MKLKKTGLGFALLSGVCTATYGTQADGNCLKIGVVDQIKIYDNFYKTKPAQENFQMLAKQAQLEYEKMMQKGKELFEERDRLVKKHAAPAISEDAKKDLEKQIAAIEEKIQKKGEEIARFRQEKDMQLEEQRQTILAEHFKEIKASVEYVAKEKKLDLILNESAGAVLYVKPEADITMAVIENVNKASKNTAKSSSK